MPLRVLVIDDDPTLLVILEEGLKDQGADVVTSDFPDDVADLIRQVHPDVVVLDLVSSSTELDGLVILGNLRADPLTATVPVLLMSASRVWLSALAPRLRDMRIGVIVKPFDIEHLWQMIEQAVV